MKLFATPEINGIDFKKAKIQPPVHTGVTSYTAKFLDLKISLNCAHTEIREPGWKAALKFISYREIVVHDKADREVLRTGNMNQADAVFAFYKLYKKWPTCL